MTVLDPTVFVNQELIKETTEEELNSMYLELGKAYYEGGFEDPLPELLPMFDKISNYKREIELKELKERQTSAIKNETHSIEESAKGYRFCTKCGHKIKADARFCGKCGQKVLK